MPNRNRVIPPRKYQEERRWRGTVFSRNGAPKSSQPNRWSSQLRTLRKKLISRLPPPPHEYLVPSHLHLKGFQRARRRPRNISAVEVIPAVVAGGPHPTQNLAGLGCGKERGGEGRHG